MWLTPPPFAHSGSATKVGPLLKTDQKYLQNQKKYTYKNPSFESELAVVGL